MVSFHANMNWLIQCNQKLQQQKHSRKNSTKVDVSPVPAMSLNRAKPENVMEGYADDATAE